MASTTLPFAAARQFMVDSQLRPNKVTHPALLDAMRVVPRELFLPPALSTLAYADQDVELGGGRVLMAPLAFARLAQLLAPLPGERVLVVGAATGYGAAVLARCGARVTALDEDESLLDIGRAAFRPPGPRRCDPAGRARRRPARRATVGRDPHSRRGRIGAGAFRGPTAPRHGPVGDRVGKGRSPGGGGRSSGQRADRRGDFGRAAGCGPGLCAHVRLHDGTAAGLRDGAGVPILSWLSRGPTRASASHRKRQPDVGGAAPRARRLRARQRALAIGPDSVANVRSDFSWAAFRRPSSDCPGLAW